MTTPWSTLNRGAYIDHQALIQELEDRCYLIEHGITRKTQEALDQFDQELEELLSDEPKVGTK